MLENFTTDFANDMSKKLDAWLKSYCGTIAHTKNFKLKSYQNYTECQTEYCLYPRRGRNAKKRISTFIFKYNIKDITKG